MNNLQFIRRLYKGKTCYSDSLSDAELEQLQLSSGVDDIIEQMVKDAHIIFLTGNPGDGKTFIIRRITKKINRMPFIQ